MTDPAFWSEKPEAWREVMPGVHRRILAHSTTGLMVMYKIEAERVFPLHDHPHAQFGVFLRGSGIFKVGDSSRKVKEGDTYFIPPGVPHELRTSEQSLVVDFFTPEREDYALEALEPDNPSV